MRAIASRNEVPDAVRKTIPPLLADPAPEVRIAAIQTVALLGLKDAVPRLLAMAQKGSERDEATRALTVLPDPNALPIYLEALNARDPGLRKAAEGALLTIRDQVAAELEARSADLKGPAAEAVERVLTRFQPIVPWKVIGPFPRTTAQVFVGERSIDFGKPHVGAEGRTIHWQNRQADPATGQVNINDFKAGAGDVGGFGYDTNGSPDLAAFAYAEIPAETDREALLLIGSSGSITVLVNEQPVFNYSNFAGRPYQPDRIGSGSNWSRG